MSPPPSRLVRTVFPGKPAGATFFEWGQKVSKGTGFSGNFVRASPRGTICTRSLPASNAGAEEAEKTNGVMNLSLRDRVRLHQDRAPKFLSPRPQPRAVARDLEAGSNTLRARARLEGTGEPPRRSRRRRATRNALPTSTQARRDGGGRARASACLARLGLARARGGTRGRGARVPDGGRAHDGRRVRVVAVRHVGHRPRRAQSGPRCAGPRVLALLVLARGPPRPPRTPPGVPSLHSGSACAGMGPGAGTAGGC